MLNAIIHALRFQDTIEGILAITDGCCLKIVPCGLSIKAVDPASVAMVSLDLTVNEFESHEDTEGLLDLDADKINSILEIGIDYLMKIGFAIAKGYGNYQRSLLLRIGV